MADGAQMPYWDSDKYFDSDTIIGQDDEILGDEYEPVNQLFDNDWAVESFSPKDKLSTWNQYGGQYAPLLADVREVELKVAITEGGAARPADNDPAWQTLFRGVLGDDIDTEGNPVTCSARDLARYLQDTVVEDEREYSTNKDQLLEAMLQQVIADWWPGDNAPTIQVLAWDAPTKAYAAETSGVLMNPYKPEIGKSLWDVCVESCDKFGLWIGYWPGDDGVSKLTIIKPVEGKDASNAEFRLDWRDNVLVSRLNVKSDDIRNAVRLEYTDASTGLRMKVYPHADLDAIVVEGPTGTKTNYTDAKYAPYLKSNTSIAAHRRRVAWVSEAATSWIDTLDEAVTFGNRIVNGLEEYVGTESIDLPLCPEMRLFAGVTVNDPMIGLTNSDFFAVDSFEHEIKIEADPGQSRFVTWLNCSGKITGGHTRWLAIEKRPGSPSSSIPGSRVTGPTPNAPAGLTVTNSGVEAVGQDTQSYVALAWSRPSGIASGESYVLEVQTDGGDWSKATQYTVKDARQKVILPGGLTYQARVACVSKEGVQGAWSSAISFDMPRDGTAPTIMGISVVPTIGGVTVKLRATGAIPTDWSIAGDWAGAVIYMHTVSGFPCDAAYEVARGKQTSFDISLPLAQGQTYYFKAVVYDTSFNYSAPSAEESGQLGKADTSDIASGAITGYTVYSLNDTSGALTTSTTYVDIPNCQISFTLDDTALVMMIFNCSVGVEGPNLAMDPTKHMGAYYTIAIDGVIQSVLERKIEIAGTETEFNWLDGSVVITHIAQMNAGTHAVKALFCAKSLYSTPQAIAYKRELQIVVFKR
jgi:hypothetical protein